MQVLDAKMHKIHNFTGQARQSMGFGMHTRPQQQHQHHHQPHQHHPQADHQFPMPGSTPVQGQGKRSLPLNPNPAVRGHAINLSFNVPFNSNLPGPECREDVLYSSTNACQKWTHPEGAAEDTPIHALPIHTRNVEDLRRLCKQMSDNSGDQVQATVTSSKPKPVPGMQRGPLSALITNVCISGDAEVVHKMRAKILNETPITLVSN